MTVLPLASAPADLRATPDFSAQVRRGFGRQAGSYEHHARLQQAVAWRLGRLCRTLPLAAGPCADLGAGSGLLSRALVQHWPALAGRSPLQLDQCPELLARNPLGPGLLWDLNNGLPQPLERAALLVSSFALQWLDAPAPQLRHWAEQLRPGGWLVLALPTSGSFPQWHQAAARAGVACTGLGLPAAQPLLAAAAAGGVTLARQQVLRFSRPRQGGLATLRHLRQLGASASRQPPLPPGKLRRLLAHWPAGTPLTWEVLLLLGRKD
jgi:malonyl-CoA O-methyltransferase